MEAFQNNNTAEQSHYYYILELDTSKKRDTKSYGFSIYKDQWDILEILKKQKTFHKKSDGLKLCIDYTFQVGAILLKYSDENFIIQDPKIWSHKDYNIYFDNMQKIKILNEVLNNYFTTK